MNVVGAAPRAVFSKLQTLGVILFVLGGSIGPLPAHSAGKLNNTSSVTFFGHFYSIIRVKVPAPTVLPPSRTAKRKPVSRATG